MRLCSENGSTISVTGGLELVFAAISAVLQARGFQHYEKKNKYQTKKEQTLDGVTVIV
jgi:hypothetical protein